MKNSIAAISLFAAVVPFAASRIAVTGNAQDDIINESRELGGASCYFDSVGSSLKSDGKKSYFERKEGICSGAWGFGLTKGGRLRLYNGSNQVWDSGKTQMDFCNMNQGGAFACYKGEPFKPQGGARYAVNCGGNEKSFMEIKNNAEPVVQKKNDAKTWGIEKDGDVVGTCVEPSGETEATLIAKYTWKKGAKDVSKSPHKHNGRLDSGAAIKNRKLICKGWDGVNLGPMEELKKATKVKFQFKDVEFLGFPGLCDGPTSQYSVLVGGGYEKWWVAVNHECPHGEEHKDEEWYRPNGQTELIFNVGGFGRPSYEHKVVMNKMVTKFKKIEYRFDGTEDSKTRLAIRYNEGRWKKGGWKKDGFFPTFPDSTYDVLINDGARADWDPTHCKLGPISFWSN